MIMKMTTNKDNEANVTTEQNPSVEIEIQRSDYAKSMDESPKLWEDKAQGSKNPKQWLTSKEWPQLKSKASVMQC